MFSFGRSAFGQGVIVVDPNPQPYYSTGYPGTFDFDVDIDGDGTTDFIFRSNDSSYGLNNAVLIPVGANEVATASLYLANLSLGNSVGASLDWSNSKTTISVTGELLGGQPFEEGNFAYQTSGYIGFDLVKDGQNYYGWMEVSSILDTALYGTITEWAYETSPNTSIVVGEVPEPSMWALLTLGALFLFGRGRHRRNTASAL